ncbi:hypothetical protein SAMN04488523_103307 [Sulfitobacter brevis]|uniref:Uncharacterized protein n=1 Tax=Sulfitobacter brevis TaxID=74348 RepID=A0A1I1W7Y5_9RHOB|nr:hypothetical protein [Sulfitobacter brevis]SFD90548.1 hypothetical protein SAMN04488523_103307 [Sulfitobacter brevis]
MFKTSLLALAILGAPAFADTPVVENVNVTKSGDLWRFDVTISHTDKGWDDYADAWRILDGDGKELGLRDLAHPHTDEQPFTRSLSGVVIPASVTEVTIQPRDTINGWASDGKKIKLR